VTGLYGYIDQTGKYVIESQFADASLILISYISDAETARRGKQSEPRKQLRTPEIRPGSLHKASALPESKL
jgi:hypothetical protein